MAQRTIKEMTPGEQIADQIFLIASKDLRTTSNGSLYIHAVLADKTGQVPARIWQASEEQYKMIPEGGYLRIRGRTESYKGKLQFIIEGLKTVQDSEVNVSDFLPSTEGDVEEMFTKVKTILRTIKDGDLLQLIKCFIEDQELVAKFKRAPAAVKMHHAYCGGLLEHTLNLLELAQLVIPRYPALNLDLVLAGLFLHDIGKTQELKYDTAFQYSDEGQLLGHIVHAVIWIEEKVKQVEQSTGKPFPKEKKTALQHIIVSHHGQYEFGSPKLPAMPEAIAVHYLDNFDAKVYQYQHLIEIDPDPQATWTSYQHALGTKIYKGSARPEGS